MRVLAELKELIVERMDPDLVLELLDISTEELCDAFEMKIEEHRELFEDLEEDADGISSI